MLSDGISCAELSAMWVLKVSKVWLINWKYEKKGKYLSKWNSGVKQIIVYNNTINANNFHMIIQRINRTQGNLVFDLFDKYRVFYKQQSDIETAKKFIQERLDSNESVIFVALDTKDNRPIGFTQLYPKYSSMKVIKNWILNDLYVDKEFRKKGCGEKLIKTVIDFARQNGAKYVELSTAVDNYNAQHLYEHIGFKKSDPETDFFTYKISLSE